jgi:hypothetical protein
MTRITLLTLLFAASAPLNAFAFPNGATVEGVKEGWKIEANDGSISYIVQITPQQVSNIAQSGGELKIGIPDFLQGVASNVILRIGSSDVEREPSEAQIRAQTQRNLPRDNRLGAGSLTTLSDSTGGAVMIDPMRVTPNTIPTAGASTLSDTGTGFATPPASALAQNFPGSSSRSNFNNPFTDPARTASNTGLGSYNNSTQNTTVMPRTDTSPYGNSFVGPTLPPGYTGGNVTVSSNPAVPGANTGYNQWNTPTNNNGSSTPLANNNYANQNNYPAGTYNSVPSLGYSTLPNNNSNGNFMNSAPSFNTNALNSNAYTPNIAGQSGTYPPAAYTASNHSLGATPNFSQNPNTSVGMGVTGYNNHLMQPPVVSAMNNNGMYNSGQPSVTTSYQHPSPGMNTYQPSAYLSSNIGIPSSTPSINPNQRTIRSDADYAREYGQPSSLNFMFVLFLLASAVANVYLLMQLNHLLQRYRSLQATSRGTSSYAV